MLRMKQLGVLASTDGPFHNVIKVKPPLCMTTDDASRLVAALDQALCELDFKEHSSSGQS